MNKVGNGCWCSEFNVNPKNWKSTKKTNSIRVIEYYFHDPAFKSLYPGGYQKTIKSGINWHKTAIECRAVVNDLIELEAKMLRLQGYLHRLRQH